MKRAVESFEDDRGHFGGGARTRRGVAAVLLLAALSLTACDRSKVVIEVDWDNGAIVQAPKTKILVVFTYPDMTTERKVFQPTTPSDMLPLEPPLTLVYWVDDPNKKISVHVELRGPDDEPLLLSDTMWDGKPILLCVGVVKCKTPHDGGAGGAGPDAGGGHGGAAVGGHPGTGGAASGGAGGAGGSMNMTASGGAGGKGEGGKGGAPMSSSGGSMGGGGKGGISIGPLGGSTGQAGVIGTGGIIPIGGNPGTGGVGTGGVGTGGASTGGTASGGSNGSGTGGMIGTGGIASTGGATGSGGAPVPSCLTNTTVACTCDDYCDALGKYCTGRFTYFPTRQDCVTSCTGFNWNPGTIDPTTHPNTIGCRVAQTQEARCTQASPTGGGYCGGQMDLGRCSVYCEALDSNCPGDLHPFRTGNCMAVCASPPALKWEAMEKLSMTSTPTSGNTGNCRLYWAGQAGTTTATTEDKRIACKNAGSNSDVCL